MPQEPSLIVIYRVDEQDRIIYANDDWDRFARLNNSLQLQREHIVGNAIWDFIVDAETQQVYRDLMVCVRRNRPVSFHYRCDSPTMQRVLEMHVHRVNSGAVQFTSSTIVLSQHEPIDLLDAQRDHAGDPLRICGWCKRVEFLGQWVEIEDAGRHMRLPTSQPLPPLMHTMCGPCYSRIQDLIHRGRGVQEN